jgi:hypothetical protein
MQQGFFYDFSNYGIYDRLADSVASGFYKARDASDPEIIEVAEKFVLANCYDPKRAMKLFICRGCQVWKS